MRMSVAVVGSRGRVVLPREVRDALHLLPGDSLFFLIEGEQVRLSRAPEDIGEYLALYGGSPDQDLEFRADEE